MKFERLHEPMIPRGAFYRRLLRSFIVATFLIGGSLLLGTVGYHVCAGLPWMDAMLNAAMILTGMGPVDRLTTASGKWFATAYALFSGVAFLSGVSVLIAPVAHRFLHQFHVTEDQPDS
jgi:hypothetical protein